MHRYLIIIFINLSALFSLNSEALYRDYYPYISNLHCSEHLVSNQLKHSDLTHELAKFLPATHYHCWYIEDFKTWTQIKCPNKLMYNGYVDYYYCRYRLHLKRHLEYCQKNLYCNCYWPEYTEEAAKISDFAYLLFRDLLVTTELSKLFEDTDEQSKFISNNTLIFGLHDFTIAFIARQMHFVDYYYVCRDIENYSISTYEEEEAAQIKDKLEDILEALYPKFFSLYTSCYEKHPNEDIKKEIQFMKLLINDGFKIEDPLQSLQSLSTSKMINKYHDTSEFIFDKIYATNVCLKPEGKNILNEGTIPNRKNS